MPTIEQWIEALKRRAGNADVIQLRNKDGSLTEPMSISVAAEYLYNGTKPRPKILPSEQIAAQQDRQWAENKARRQTEAARTRANEYNTRSFYIDVALPTLTFGLSKYIPGLKGTANSYTDPLLASSVAVSKSPIGKLFWPAAAAAATWGWYANTHEPPMYINTGSRLYNEAATNTEQSADTTRTATPSTPTNTETSSSQGSQSRNTPAPANPDPNDNKKGFKDKQKKVASRIKKGYENALVGLEYGLGFGAPIAGLGYGAYKWMQPNKTRADSILDSQLYQVGELNKAVQINENQKKIDAILQQIQSGSPQTQSNDSNYVAPQQVVNPTDTLDF